jgi:allophanate hydrolase subunit 1
VAGATVAAAALRYNRRRDRDRRSTGSARPSPFVIDPIAPPPAHPARLAWASDRHLRIDLSAAGGDGGRVLAAFRLLQQHARPRIPAILDLTPAFGTILLAFDLSRLDDPAAAERAVRDALAPLDDPAPCHRGAGPAAPRCAPSPAPDPAPPDPAPPGPAPCHRGAGPAAPRCAPSSAPDPAPPGPAPCHRGAGPAAPRCAPSPAPAPPRLVEIPACYDDPALAPDLADVARLAGLSPARVVELHAGALYTVRFIGFAPGFPYLDGLPPALHVPRLDRPRPRVPAGSVAVAADQCGIYPAPTPGGWRLIARTPLRLFDPSLAQAQADAGAKAGGDTGADAGGRAGAALDGPCFLRIGDRVRFVPIPADRFPRAAGAALA